MRLLSSLWVFKYVITFCIFATSIQESNSFHLEKQFQLNNRNIFHRKVHQRSSPSSVLCVERTTRSDSSFDNPNLGNKSSRRSFLSSLIIPTSAIVAATSTTPTIKPAFAAGRPGLVQFPCKNGLGNTYHLMRAGESLLEAEDIWTTNPLFLTNREAALSETGIAQVQVACQKLEEKEITLTRVKYSLAANCIDSANIVGKDLKVGRDRLVPEFTFMDPRAIGMWDMSRLSIIEPAVWALDVESAGSAGTGAKPPPNVDGTPNETLSNQVIRLVQLMSVLETQYSGDNILLIFPDGTSPALLTALIGGIPLNRVHEMDFQSGEIYLNVTYDNALQRIPSPLNPDAQSTDEEYLNKIKVGKEELQKLRDDPDRMLNVKDLQDEELIKREKEKEDMIAKAKAENALKEKERKEAMLQKVKEDKEARQVAIMKAKEEREAKEANAREARKALEAKAREERLAREATNKNNIDTTDETISIFDQINPLLSSVGILGAIGVSSMINKDDTKELESDHKNNTTQLQYDNNTIEVTIPSNLEVNKSEEVIKMSKNMTDALEFSTNANSSNQHKPKGSMANSTSLSESKIEAPDELASDNTNVDLKVSLVEKVDILENNQTANVAIYDNTTELLGLHHNQTKETNNSTSAEGLTKDKDIETKSDDLLNEIAANQNLVLGMNRSNDNKEEREELAPSPEAKAKKAMEDYINQDDGGDAWRGMLSDLISEE